MHFTKEEVIDRCILYGYRGSMAHGTYQGKENPDSIDDVDTIGMMIAPLSCYFGMWRFEQFEQAPTEKDHDDIVIYEIRKYFALLLNSNPNVLSLLWLEPNHYIKVTQLGQRVLEQRSIFVSKKIYHSFTGYAYGQLRRMTHFKFEGYMGEKRKALVNRHGYDTKNAAHLIRLLRMGIEFLVEGNLYVLRKDSANLLEIKAGQFTLEQIKEMADRLFDLANKAYVESKLPSEPNFEAANTLLVGILRDHFYQQAGDVYGLEGDLL